ncbi:MAG: hypothetical protein GXZ04_03790 [Clostridiales bacterium]|nr:hypothetical protein [Clostridiales bacterium]
MPETLFYRFKEGRIHPVEEGDFLHHGAGICFVSPEFFKAHYKTLGLDEAIINDLNTERSYFRSSLDVYHDSSVGYLNIINVDDLEADMDRVLFIIKKELLCLVSIQDQDGSEAALLASILDQEKNHTSIARVFYRFLERLLKGGNRKLESIEDELLALEDRVVSGQADEEMNKVIYGYRRQLSLIRNYYEQLLDIATELEEDENQLFEDKHESFFRVLSTRAERLITGVRALSESLTQLREMLDAALNYALNNIMKVFTLITAIFLPLTLIVGWYGMNFKHMPELEWKLAYPVLLVVFVLIIAGTIAFFKKKKLM